MHSAGRRGIRGLKGPWQVGWGRRFLLLAVLPALVRAADPTQVEALKGLSLEELLDLQVTSVSRRSERASEVAAAVQVISADEIRRSGARTLPGVLRLAPNLQVAQADARNWAISARGFNATFSNKLLVLMDGRSVYTPLYAGVFWDVQDTLLADIERIEVISGPGATLWGANAVNGVINVITKSSANTQGLLVSGGGGTEHQGFGSVRYGGEVNDDLHYRVYAKAFSRDSSQARDGSDERDAWHHTQAGFRVDWQPSEARHLVVQGDVYGGEGEQGRPGDIEHKGGNLLARLTQRLGFREEVQFQVYYDHTDRLVPGDFGDRLDTFDLDAQYERDLGERHHLMVGAGYRYTHNEVENFAASAFLPPQLDRSLYSAFVQDEMTLVEDRLKLTAGVKFEHNDYTGLEVQPSIRAAWLVNEHTFWGAVSRAVRTPSRFDRDLYAPQQPPYIIAGGPNTVAEKLIAYELGWRTQLRESVLLAATAFAHVYDDIRTISMGPPFVIENNSEGEIYGVELSGTWQVTPDWRINAGYTHLSEDLRVKPGREDLANGEGEAFDPRHQIHLRSSTNFTSNLELDLWLRYVDRIGNTSARGFGIVPSYLTLDARLGWRPRPDLELALVGQNLLESEHQEFGGQRIERGVYGQFTWRY